MCPAEVAPQPADNALPQGKSVGPYTILEEIGAGGWGIVYKAKDANNRIVAIKEFYPQSIARRARQGDQVQVNTAASNAYQIGLEKFKEEAARLREVNHRSIVKALDYVEQDQTGYLVMNFVEGPGRHQPAPSLDRVAPLATSMVPEAVERLADELMSALEALHERNIIHRDMAPDNILMAGKHSVDPTIIDLGGSRSVTAFLSNTMEALVKPGFTPMEQYAVKYANDKPPEPSADIYATAAVLYRVITGNNPLEAVVRAFGNPLDPPLEPARFPAFDAKFLYGVDQGLSLRAHDRPQSIAAWRKLIKEGPLKREQSPDPDPWWRRLVNWPLNGSLAVKFALAALVCLILGFVIGNARGHVPESPLWQVAR